jgi:hypothetical protein
MGSESLAGTSGEETNQWKIIEHDLLFVSSPLEESLGASHLPDLFRDLVNRLRYPLPGRAQVSPGAAGHGLLRRRQGCAAAMLVEEARMLEVSIFHTLRSNAHRIDFSVLLPDVMVIADEVDSQLAQAVESYTAVWNVCRMNPPAFVTRYLIASVKAKNIRNERRSAV